MGQQREDANRRATWHGSALAHSRYGRVSTLLWADVHVDDTVCCPEDDARVAAIIHCVREPLRK